MQFDQLRRRQFIRVLSGAAVLSPRAARAQQVRPVVGYLYIGTPEGSAALVAGIPQRPG
jgi:hypothetical protein